LLLAAVASIATIGIGAAVVARVRLARAILVAAAVVSVALPWLGGPQPARASVSFGSELMRVTNLDRVALGYPALAVDPTLVGLAGGAPFHCPSASTMVLDGRADDMAQRGYFSHEIKGCADATGVDYTILDVLAAEFGYDTYSAETIGEWSGGLSAPTAYRAGCDTDWATCVGGTTSLSAAVAGVERTFMSSSDHRGIILGSYDRFGCGAAQGRSGQTYFACIFSLGGPDPVDPSPPTVASASGSHATLAPGRPYKFTAVVHDNVRLASATASLDGTRLGTWRYPDGGRNSTLRLTIASARLAPGTHRLVWRVVDAAGGTAARSVTFTVT